MVFPKNEFDPHIDEKMCCGQADDRKIYSESRFPSYLIVLNFEKKINCLIASKNWEKNLSLTETKKK